MEIVIYSYIYIVIYIVIVIYSSSVDGGHFFYTTFQSCGDNPFLSFFPEISWFFLRSLIFSEVLGDLNFSEKPSLLFDHLKL